MKVFGEKYENDTREKDPIDFKVYFMKMFGWRFENDPQEKRPNG